MLSPNLVVVFGNLVVPDLDVYYMAISIYQTGLIVLANSIYQSSALQFIIEIYYNHFFAYKSHIKSLVGLFIATEVTLLSLLLFQINSSMTLFCFETEKN